MGEPNDPKKSREQYVADLVKSIQDLQNYQELTKEKKEGKEKFDELYKLANDAKSAGNIVGIFFEALARVEIKNKKNDTEKLNEKIRIASMLIHAEEQFVPGNVPFRETHSVARATAVDLIYEHTKGTFPKEPPITTDLFMDYLGTLSFETASPELKAFIKLFSNAPIHTKAENLLGKINLGMSPLCVNMCNILAGKYTDGQIPAEVARSLGKMPNFFAVPTATELNNPKGQRAAANLLKIRMQQMDEFSGMSSEHISKIAENVIQARVDFAEQMRNEGGALNKNTLQAREFEKSLSGMFESLVIKVQEGIPLQTAIDHFRTGIQQEQEHIFQAFPVQTHSSTETQTLPQKETIKSLADRLADLQGKAEKQFVDLQEKAEKQFQVTKNAAKRMGDKAGTLKRQASEGLFGNAIFTTTNGGKSAPKKQRMSFTAAFNLTKKRGSTSSETGPATPSTADTKPATSDSTKPTSTRPTIPGKHGG